MIHKMDVPATSCSSTYGGEMNGTVLDGVNHRFVVSSSRSNMRNEVPRRLFNASIAPCQTNDVQPDDLERVLELLSSAEDVILQRDDIRHHPHHQNYHQHNSNMMMASFLEPTPLGPDAFQGNFVRTSSAVSPSTTCDSSPIVSNAFFRGPDAAPRVASTTGLDSWMNSSKNYIGDVVDNSQFYPSSHHHYQNTMNILGRARCQIPPLSLSASSSSSSFDDTRSGGRDDYLSIPPLMKRQRLNGYGGSSLGVNNGASMHVENFGVMPEMMPNNQSDLSFFTDQSSSSHGSNGMVHLVSPSDDTMSHNYGGSRGHDAMPDAVNGIHQFQHSALSYPPHSPPVSSSASSMGKFHTPIPNPPQSPSDGMSKGRNGNDDTKGGAGRFRQYQADQWNDRYEELVAFVAEHGHCLVPHSYPPNQQLAQWVKRQRYQRKLKLMGRHSTLSDERQEFLTRTVGFVWDSHKAAWEEKYQSLIAFWQENGHSNVPSNYHDQALAVWTKCQRRQARQLKKGLKCTMTEERYRLLDKIGFDWNPRNL